MRLAPPVLIVVGMAAGTWVAYEYWPRDPPALPVEHTLSDQQGREIEARILARSNTEVQFVRLSDGVIFRYPLTDLSKEDQVFLQAYPATIIPTPKETVKKPPTERERLLARQEVISYQLKLIQVDLKRENPANSGHTKDELLRDRARLLDERLDIEKRLLEIAYLEKLRK